MAREFDPHGFDLLLELLSDGPGAHGEDREWEARASDRYRLLRSKIDCFLERRGCLDHEDATDETICRVTSLLPGKRGEIKSIQAFCLGVAKFVNLEYLRRQSRADQLPEDYLDHPPSNLVSYPDHEGRGAADKVLDRMRECFSKLSLEDQELMARYEASGRSGKQKLADELGISLKALQERRVFSIRKGLRQCLENCLGRCPEKAKRPVKLAGDKKERRCPESKMRPSENTC
ncbi:MAG TPA: hypothetical protein VJ302_10980 [Blastocatellia bacterium]|nr:hypothetical protein [Blastocatellia bacterium]